MKNEQQQQAASDWILAQLEGVVEVAAKFLWTTRLVLSSPRLLERRGKAMSGGRYAVASLVASTVLIAAVSRSTGVSFQEHIGAQARLDHGPTLAMAISFGLYELAVCIAIAAGLRLAVGEHKTSERQLVASAGYLGGAHLFLAILGTVVSMVLTRAFPELTEMASSRPAFDRLLAFFLFLPALAGVVGALALPMAHAHEFLPSSAQAARGRAAVGVGVAQMVVVVGAVALLLEDTDASEFRGHLRLEGTAVYLQECGRGERLHVALDQGVKGLELLRNVLEQEEAEDAMPEALRPVSRASVTLTGRLSPKGSFGQSGQFGRELMVEEIRDAGVSASPRCANEN